MSQIACLTHLFPLVLFCLSSLRQYPPTSSSPLYYIPYISGNQVFLEKFLSVSHSLQFKKCMLRNKWVTEQKIKVKFLWDVRMFWMSLILTFREKPDNTPISDNANIIREITTYKNCVFIHSADYLFNASLYTHTISVHHQYILNTILHYKCPLISAAPHNHYCFSVLHIQNQYLLAAIRPYRLLVCQFWWRAHETPVLPQSLRAQAKTNAY